MNENFGDLRAASADAHARQSFVTRLFDDLAPHYDRFNRWVSFHRDEAWRRNTIAQLGPRAGGIVLDLAAGTGALAQNALQHGAASVHVFDISLPMLLLAKDKLRRDSTRVALELGSAHLLPFRDASFDGVVSGFAMRNVFHFLDEVLQEIHRVLKPGGRVAILEMSRPQNRIVRSMFLLHMKTVMPLVGKLASGKTQPFAYLFDTTMSFLSPQDFKKRLENAGFVDVGWKPQLLGGIAIHFGSKPA